MTKKFTVDARTILHLGRDSIKDHTTALLELVKNSYDADATYVEVEIMCQVRLPYIRIADNGCGMNENDITNHWLRIGFSEKRQNRVSTRGRRKTGEKGIGRISADRLGSLLAIRTQTKQDGVIGLCINWEDFETDRNLSDIPISEAVNPKISIPKDPDINEANEPNSGTELIVLGLRQEWTVNDIENLYRELSMLVSPFIETVDFEVKLRTDVVEGYDDNVQSELYDNYEIRLDIQYDGKSKEIPYKLTERDPAQLNNKQELVKSISRNELVIGTVEDNEVDFGNVEVVFMYYPRVARILEGSGFSLTDLKSFLNNNAGVKIYRDNIRVKPYGNLDAPEGDWLRLGELVARDPAGAGRGTFLIRPTQLVGAVFIGRDTNPNLVDSTSREGLVNNSEFNALQDFLLGFVRVLSSRYHEKFVGARERDVAQIPRSPSEEVRELFRELSKLREELRAIKRLVTPEANERIESAFAQVDVTANKIEETQEIIEGLVSENQVYRGLATIGISATVFGHEIQTAIDNLLGSLSNANGFLELSPIQTADAIEYIQKAREHAGRVKSWGNFALDRVRRDKRQRTLVNIEQIVEEIIKEFKPTMDAVNITVKFTIEPISGRIFPIDVETLLINLLTNAYAACMQQSKNRMIRVELQRQRENGSSGCALIVADSGPGVAEEFRNQIWKPLFSNKQTKSRKKRNQSGTGLGLTIVQSIVTDLKGSAIQDSDPELGGARFTIWFPLNQR